MGRILLDRAPYPTNYLKLILMRRFRYVSIVGLKWLSCASLLGAPLLIGQEEKRSLGIGAHENLPPHGRGGPCQHMRARLGYLDLLPVSPLSSSHGRCGSWKRPRNPNACIGLIPELGRFQQLCWSPRPVHG